VCPGCGQNLEAPQRYRTINSRYFESIGYQERLTVAEQRVLCPRILENWTEGCLPHPAGQGVKLPVDVAAQEHPDDASVDTIVHRTRQLRAIGVPTAQDPRALDRK
jgi:hypothetical protein